MNKDVMLQMVVHVVQAAQVIARTVESRSSIAKGKEVLGAEDSVRRWSSIVTYQFIMHELQTTF